MTKFETLHDALSTFVASNDLTKQQLDFIDFERRHLLFKITKENEKQEQQARNDLKGREQKAQYDFMESLYEGGHSDV